jgi:hypothetical protein
MTVFTWLTHWLCSYVSQYLEEYAFKKYLCDNIYILKNSWTRVFMLVSGFPPRRPGFQPGSCGICGGQSGTGTGFDRVLRFPLPIFISPIVQQSSSSSTIWGWYNRPNSGHSTKWTQSHTIWKKIRLWQSVCWSTNSPSFVKSECSLLWSQETATSVNHRLVELSPYTH